VQALLDAHVARLTGPLVPVGVGPSDAGLEEGLEQALERLHSM